MTEQMRKTVGADDWEYEAWVAEHLNVEVMERAEALPMRRDLVTLIEYVRDHKVTGTQSTGNLPLKVIRAVTAQFINPPELDQKIGEHVYKLRTEFDVWPLYFLHLLAEIGDLITGGPGLRIRLTEEGADFLEADPLHQVLHLLTIWWFRVNWLSAFATFDLGEYPPDNFELITLDRLRMLPVGRRTEADTFADSLINRTGFAKQFVPSDHLSGILRSAVRKMVIEPCADFGIVAPELKDLGPPIPPRVVAFRVTPFGRALLSALALLVRDA